MSPPPSRPAQWTADIIRPSADRLQRRGADAKELEACLPINHQVRPAAFRKDYWLVRIRRQVHVLKASTMYFVVVHTSALLRDADGRSGADGAGCVAYPPRTHPPPLVICRHSHRARQDPPPGARDGQVRHAEAAAAVRAAAGAAGARPSSAANLGIFEDDIPALQERLATKAWQYVCDANVS